MIALTKFSHLETLIKTWVDRYKVTIEYNPTVYSTNDALFNDPNCPNVLGAFLVYSNGGVKIAFNFNNKATDQELLTVILHEIGHHIDRQYNPGRYNRLTALYSSGVQCAKTLSECEIAAWKIAIAEANKMNFKMCETTIRLGLDSYGLKLDDVYAS